MATPTSMHRTGLNKVILIAFESGRSKKVTGRGDGNGSWLRFKTKDGGLILVNRDKVEYIESFGQGEWL